MATPTVDLAANYVLIDGHRAHPTRLLARVKPNLARAVAAVIQPFSLHVETEIRLTPGTFILDATTGLPAPVASAEEAKARGDLMQDRIKALLQTGHFDFVEPDYIVSIAAVPTDQAFTNGTLWGLRNLGLSGGVVGADIDAARAWDVTTGSANVIVGVVDTGIRYTHNELAAQMWRNPGEIAGNGIDDDADGYIDNVFGINAVANTGNPLDNNGHGTHCAGTIGAAANGGGQHVGVAWQVRLMALKFLDASGNGSIANAIKCIDFAVGKGVRILSNSWGGAGNSTALSNAIAAARDRGVLFVAAAGNGGADGIADNNDQLPHYPSNFPIDSIIAVAALDREDKLAGFSNYGAAQVDVGAPGVDILSCWFGSDTDYRTIGGTSMATPHVAGVAALILAQFPNVALVELRQRILGGAVPIAAMAGRSTSGGRVNAFNAVTGGADGILEVTVLPSNGTQLVGGTNTPFYVQVTDTTTVLNATVIGTIVGGPTVAFGNAGAAPDVTGGDHIYSAAVPVPGSGASFTLQIEVTAPGKTKSTTSYVFPILQPVANDAFAARATISGSSATVAGSNVGTTKEAGEPNHGGFPGGASVWWTWTAPGTGPVTIKTDGSSYDTLLGVYTGGAVSSLTLVAGDDDTGAGFASLVSFNATAGTTYQIAVDGFGGATGAITLDLVLVTAQVAPANDNFASSATISGTTATVYGSNSAATKQTGEPNHGGNAGGRSVWWRWTATESGVATVTTDGSLFDTTLGVYTGGSVAALTTVASDNDSGEGARSLVSFNAVAGTTYHMAVDGFNAAVGGITLMVTLVIPPPVPANDSFASRTSLSGATVTTTGTNAGASKEANEPEHAGNSGGKSVWWTWTAPTAGSATITTSGSNFDTLLAVYTGSSVAALTVVASNNDDPAGSNTSRLDFTATAGTTYQIAVDGGMIGLVGASGSISLAVALTAPPTGPANDSFAARTSVGGSFVSVTGSSVGATKEAGEPLHGGNAGGRSVWWTWTAPTNGTATIATDGSDFDTLLGVYTGTAVSALTTVGSDDDSGEGLRSLVTFNAVAGTNYQIAVDGFGASAGSITLIVSLVAPAPAPVNDNFASRIAITGASTALPGTNVGATKETGEPLHGGNAGGGSVWWTWTAPFTGTATITTSGSNFDTLLGVYTGSSVAALTLVAGNDQDPLGGNTSRVTFFTTAGAVYQIAVDGSYSGLAIATGSLTLDVALAAAPANDQFASRTSLTGASTTVTGSNDGASKETGEPNHAGLAGGRSVWWSWTAPASGAATIKTDGSTFDTILGVYTGSAVSGLVTVAGDDDTGAGSTSLVTINATAGTVYQIAVDGYDAASGSVTVTVTLGGAVPGPANDNFANRTTITGSSATVTGTNANAGKETGEPSHAGNAGGRSVWWTWAAPITGTATVTTSGSAFDTLLAVYTGGTVAALSSVASNDQDPLGGSTSRVTFSVTAGTVYHLAVDGVFGASGNISLALSSVAATPLGLQLFGSDSSVPTRLFQVNSINAALTPVGQSSSYLGLDFRPNGVLYGSAASLVTVSPTNGSATMVGVLPELIVSIAFSPGDQLYGLGNGGLTLHRLDPATGASLGSVPVTGTTLSNGSPFPGELFGIEFGPDGTLYGIGLGLYRLDPATGAATRITPAGQQVSGALFVDLDFGSDGQLRAITSDSATSLYVLNPATGMGQLVGSMGADINGLASRFVTATTAPIIFTPPAGQSSAAGGSATFSIAAYDASTYQWQHNGVSLSGANANTLVIPNVQPADAGIYAVVTANGIAATSRTAILGVSSTSKVIGTGTEVGPNITHANGNVYDQVLLLGAAATVTADGGQVVRVSFTDLNDDIVQVEFSGRGTLTLVLDNPSGPAPAASYNQPGVNYMKGHAGIVITGADETTNVSVFSVGRGNAVNQGLFRSDVAYDGHADLAYIAILSSNGRFGGLRTANASYFATRGLTGVYAPNVQFTGPVFVGDISAFDTASPVLVLGSGGDVRINGGDLRQSNGRAVAVNGISQLRFVAGSDSHDNLGAAQVNRARLEQDGVDVTAQIVLNP